MNSFLSYFSKPSLTAFLAVLVLAGMAAAGSLTPSASPASTMHTLENIWAPIASTAYDSTSVVANQNGSLLGMLKYINAQTIWASSSPDGYFLGTGNLGIGISSPTAKLSIQASNTNDNIFSIASSSVTRILNYLTVASSGHTLLDGGAANPIYITESRPGGADGMLNGVKGVVIQNKFAYMVTGSRDSFAVVDVSNPASPSFLNEVTGGGVNGLLDGANDLAVSGRYAYVAAAQRDALAVIDISKPASPTYITSLRPGGSNGFLDGASRITISGRYGYVANNARDSLAVVDLSNPANPGFVTETRPGGANGVLDGATGIVISGRYAYVVNSGRDSLAVIDVSNPASPSYIAETRPGGANGLLDSAFSVAISGRYAYVSGFSGAYFAAIDISNPASPSYRSRTRGPISGTSLGNAYGIWISGKYAYLTNNSRDSLAVIDISNPASPSYVTEIRPGGANGNLDGAAGIFVSGRYAYVANAIRDSLVIIDIGSLIVPQLDAGTIKAENLGVLGYVTFDNGIMVKGGLNIGEDAMINGTLSVNSSASFMGRVGLGTSNIDARWEINSTDTAKNIASISASTLTTGDVFNIMVPVSTSASGRYLLVRDTTGATYASLGYGGRLSLRRDITSHGANSTCTGSGTSGCIDYAESFHTNDPTLTAGEVVSIDPASSSNTIRSTGSNPIGIVSTNPAVLITGTGLLSGASTTQNPANTVPIALAGRVPVNFSDENGPVQLGDHLTASSTRPGHAMKQIIAGMTVGIALESSSPQAKSKILTFVSTSYWAPSSAAATEGTAPLTDTTSSLFRGVFAAILNAFREMLGIVFTTDGTVEMQKLCLGTTCITESQLTELLQRVRVSAPADTPIPTPMSIPTPNPAPLLDVGADTPTPTPAP